MNTKILEIQNNDKLLAHEMDRISKRRVMYIYAVERRSMSQ